MTGFEDTPWNLCSWHDTSNRRGIWFRRTPDGGLERERETLIAKGA